MPLWKKKKPKKKSANKPKPKPKQGLPPIPAKPKFEPKPFVPPKIPEYFTPPAMPTRPPEKKPASKRQAVDVENEFLKTFKSLTYRHRGWDIWKTIGSPLCIFRTSGPCGEQCTRWKSCLRKERTDEKPFDMQRVCA